MTSRQRDVIELIVKSPWWVVVGLVASGAVWGNTIQGEVQDVKQAVEEGRSPPIAQIRRTLDSLLIESRHTNETLDEFRHLLARPLRGAQRDLLR